MRSGLEEDGWWWCDIRAYPQQTRRTATPYKQNIAILPCGLIVDDPRPSYISANLATLPILSHMHYAGKQLRPAKNNILVWAGCY